MNITPFHCRCGEIPLIDATTVYETRVRCPKCGCSFTGPDSFAAVVGWNIQTKKRQNNIKNLDPSEDE